MQAENICYKAKERNYGVIKLRQAGLLTGIKLKHISGSLTCHKRDPLRTNLWGCNTKGKHGVLTVVTDTSNRVVFPANFKNSPRPFEIPGFNADISEILVFTNLAHPNFFNKGQELRIWYSEDLFNYTTDDNDGTHCVNVYTEFWKLVLKYNFNDTHTEKKFLWKNYICVKRTFSIFCKLPTNCLSVFDHFVGLALKRSTDVWGSGKFSIIYDF